MSLQTISTDFVLLKTDTVEDRELKYAQAVHKIAEMVMDMGVFKVTKGTAFLGGGFVEKCVLSIEIDMDETSNKAIIYDNVTKGNEPVDAGCSSCSN